MSVRMAPAQGFGVIVRQHRTAARLTQMELAEKSGLSVRTLNNIERGRTVPYTRSVQLLADALGLNDRMRAWLLNARRHNEADLHLGGVPHGHDGSWRIVPRQLPAPAKHFTGRRPELALLSELLDQASIGRDAVPIAVITGAAGVGKTALAVRWAHQVASHFPDGQLYIDLHGFDPSAKPVEGSQAIVRFLEALGAPTGQIPSSIEGQAALLRTAMANRRLLIVADNARHADQVRSLLPGNPACLVLVTSRNHMPGLVAEFGARPIALGILTREESRDLLKLRLGADRLSCEPAATDKVIDECAGVPLALTVAAAHILSRPALTLRDLSADLHKQSTPPDAADTDAEATSLRAVLSWSYLALSDQASDLVRFIGLHPGPDMTIAAVESLTGWSRGRCRAAATELIRAHLLSEPVPGTLTMHEFVRAYAAELADELSIWQRQAATTRMVDHYLHTAFRATQFLYQIDPAPSPAKAAAGTVPVDLANLQEALAWFDAKRFVLAAVTSKALRNGLYTRAWQLPRALKEFYRLRGLWRDWVAMQQVALAAAQRADDVPGQAASLWFLGAVLGQLNQHADAQHQLERALALYRKLGDRLGEARAQFHLGLSLSMGGDDAIALGHARRARHLAHACGQSADEAHALNLAGWLHARLGNSRLAEAYMAQALRLHRMAGNNLGEALALQIIGCMRRRAGHYQQAINCLRQAHGVSSEAGYLYHIADILLDLGDAYQEAGDLSAARESWHQALAQFERLHHPKAAEIRVKLSGGRNSGFRRRLTGLDE